MAVRIGPWVAGGSSSNFSSVQGLLMGERSDNSPPPPYVGHKALLSDWLCGHSWPSSGRLLVILHPLGRHPSCWRYLPSLHGKHGWFDSWWMARWAVWPLVQMNLLVGDFSLGCLSGQGCLPKQFGDLGWSGVEKQTAKGNASVSRGEWVPGQASCLVASSPFYSLG